MPADLSMDNIETCKNALAMCATVGPVAIALTVLVERAKKCLDFTLTLYMFDLIICTIYSGEFPTTWSWWLFKLFSLASSVLLGKQ